MDSPIIVDISISPPYSLGNNDLSTYVWLSSIELNIWINKENSIKQVTY